MKIGSSTLGRTFAYVEIGSLTLGQSFAHVEKAYSRYASEKVMKLLKGDNKELLIIPGTVIDIPEGVKHWHGAQRDSWFQHYTTHVATGGEQSNEWLEPVTDEVYNQLK